MNARHRIGQIITSLVSVAGVPVSIVLLLIHVKTKIGDAEGAAELCTTSSTVDCSVAASSGYAEIFGVPIAAIGLAFYVTMLVVVALSPMLIAPGGDKDDALTPAYVVFGAYTLALLDSVYLGIVNFTQLEMVCDKCVWLYGINLLGFIGAGLWAAGNPMTAISTLLRRIPKTLMSTATLVAAVTFAAALGGSIWQVNKMVDGEVDRSNVPALETELIDDSAAIHLHRDDAPTLGPDDALVHIVEFSDFECPHCATFAGVVTELAERYPDTIQITFRNFPLSFHPNARRVAEMSVCAHSQRKFWEFSNLAFARQRTLYDDFDDDTLFDLAEEVGINSDEARDCLSSPFASASVDQDIEAGIALELRGTPTIYINGQAYNGRLDLDSLSSVIDKTVAEVRAAKAEKSTEAPPADDGVDSEIDNGQDDGDEAASDEPSNADGEEQAADEAALDGDDAEPADSQPSNSDD